MKSRRVFPDINALIKHYMAPRTPGDNDLRCRLRVPTSPLDVSSGGTIAKGQAGEPKPQVPPRRGSWLGKPHADTAGSAQTELQNVASGEAAIGPYFFGGLEKVKCYELLLQGGHGTFLVRKSRSVNCTYLCTQ